MSAWCNMLLFRDGIKALSWDHLIQGLLYLLMVLYTGKVHGHPLPLNMPSSCSPKNAEQIVPLDDFLQSFIQENNLEEIKLDDNALPLLLDQCYLVARIGFFDLWYPCYSLASRAKVDQFKDVADSLLTMQEKWLGWTTDEKALKKIKPDFKILKKWVGLWRLKKHSQRKNRSEGRPDLLDILEAKERVREASLRIAELMRGMSYLGWNNGGKAKGCDIILSPTRKDFLGLGSFIASLNPTNHRFLWQDGLSMWTSFNRGDIHVVALEHPASYPGRGDITRGFDMNVRERTGLLQHVVQHGMDLLLAEVYEKKLHPDLAAGLSMNMVIELFKENNVRAGGGSGGTRTDAYTRFVSGSGSCGGRLVAINADNRWRHGKGKDYFVNLLRKSQKAGSKAALEQEGSKRDKRAYFVLKPDSGVGAIHLIQAPFLKSPAADAIPEGYQNDYLEFLRAYRSAFAHWLITQGKSLSDRKDPQDLLKSFLCRFRNPSLGEEAKDFQNAVCAVYGQEFTVQSIKEDSLERSFLDWLARH